MDLPISGITEFYGKYGSGKTSIIFDIIKNRNTLYINTKTFPIKKFINFVSKIEIIKHIWKDKEIINSLDKLTIKNIESIYELYFFINYHLITFIKYINIEFLIIDSLDYLASIDKLKYKELFEFINNLKIIHRDYNIKIIILNSYRDLGLGFNYMINTRYFVKKINNRHFIEL
ncbi:hypothetical protein SLOPH_1694, partial [Spraguea lophii 42_110]